MATGLRERKKLTMMRRVQVAALDLYDEHGYGDVSIENIADEAEVSVSSIYRHFGSKEGILLWNPHRADTTEEFLVPRSGESPFGQLRRITRQLLVDESAGAEDWHRRRLTYLLDEPALLESVGGQLVAATEFAATAVARRTGRAASELDVQVTAGALVGALFGALRSWHTQDGGPSLAVVMDQTFEMMQYGLPLLTDAEDSTG